MYWCGKTHPICEQHHSMCWGTTLNKRNKATEHEHLSLSASCQWMQCDHLPQAGMRCQVIENIFLQCNIFIIFKIKLSKIKLKIWHHATLINIPFILISNVCVWANSGNYRTHLEVETSSKSFSVCPTYNISNTSWKLTESRGNTAHACYRGHRAQSCQWRVKEEKITGPKEILTLWTCPEVETGSVIFLTIVMKYLTKSTYGRRRYSSSRW